MGGSRAHTDAIALVEKGIMTAQRSVSGSFLFEPDRAVTREDFLVMAMKAAGIMPMSADDSGFADDGNISAEARGYVALAKKKGYVSGVEYNGEYYFYPKNTVTSAEAAVIIDNIIGAERYVVNKNGALSVFADKGDVPVWAEESMLTLKQVGIISANSGYLYPQSELTREGAASLLGAVLRLTDKEVR